MTTAVGSRKKPPSAATRRSGYVGTIVFDALFLFALNRWPGWDVLPFLTSDMDQVIGLLNLSIVIHLGVNALYVLWDPRWLRGLGEVVTSAIGVVVVARFWQVFPFDTADDWSGWGLVAHLVLLLGIVGSAIGVVSGLVHLVQGCRRAD